MKETELLCRCFCCGDRARLTPDSARRHNLKIGIIEITQRGFSLLPPHAAHPRANIEANLPRADIGTGSRSDNRPGAALEQFNEISGNEPRPRGVDMPVARRRLAMGEKPPAIHQAMLLLRRFPPLLRRRPVQEPKQHHRVSSAFFPPYVCPSARWLIQDQSVWSVADGDASPF